jgi:hypothetical protein
VLSEILPQIIATGMTINTQWFMQIYAIVSATHREHYFGLPPGHVGPRVISAQDPDHLACGRYVNIDLWASKFGGEGIYERTTVPEKPAVLMKFRALLSNYTARLRKTYASFPVSSG